MISDVKKAPVAALKTLPREIRRHGSGSAKAFTVKSNRSLLLLLAACLYLLCFFGQKFTGAWTEDSDFNGAVWSQAGHNFLAGGPGKTLGISAPFYYGPMPVPADEYYNHHPALLALAVTGAFALLGEHEWVARIIPLCSSLAGVALLWLLVRNSHGRRAAAFSALIFAFLPMELIWGQMVNFESLTLMWVLAGFAGFTQWRLTGETRWQALMYGGFTLSMLTSWMGYIFTLVVCGWFLVFERKLYARPAFSLLAIAIATFALFLLQVFLSKAGGLDNLLQAFQFRAGHSTSRHSFTNLEWAETVGRSLLNYFPILFVALAAIGLLNASHKNKFGAGWVAVCFFIANAAYDAGFENASYIHDYASFYFIVPVAILGGIGLDFIHRWLEKQIAEQWQSVTAVALLLAILGITGWISAQHLRRPVQVLAWGNPGPQNLIPELGAVIRNEFPPGTTVMANFDPGFSPQLCYYAHNKLANGLVTAGDWKYFTAITNGKKAGIIWLGDENASKILALLDAKSLHSVTIAGIPFRIWKP